MQQGASGFDEAEERFRITLDSAPTAMVMADESGKIVLVNAETEKLFGYSRDELLGEQVEILIPHSLRGKHPGHRDGFFSKPETRRMGAGRDLFAVRKDGTEFPVEIGLNPVRFDDKVFVLSTVVDISERKQLELEQRKLNEDLLARSDELAKAEERFRVTLDSAPTAMVMVDRHGKIVLVNSETERVFGFSRDEMQGKKLEMLIPERFRPQHPDHRNHFFSAPTTRKMGVGRELFALRKDGTEFPVEIGLNPVEIDGEMFVLSAINDITERKKLERQREQYQIELEERVAERTEELASSNEALEKSNIELKQYAFVASHDLQSPLRGIAGFARMLQEEYSAELDEDANEYIERIVKGVKRLQVLIRDLLTYSRIEHEASRFQAISMEQVLDDVLLLLNESIYEAKAEVTHDSLPEVNGDASQLAHLMQNLIGNGIKYCAAETPKVHVSAAKKENQWLFSVKDNGIGIEKENFDRIFEVFKRLHTQQEYPGTGIGLALCRRIAQRHGGDIWVESQPGAGTTFSFTLNAPDSIENQTLDE